MKIVTWNTNLSPYDTSMPVRGFLAKRGVSIEKRIAGLLDYGYGDYQIAEQLLIPVKQVRNIIEARGFLHANEMTSTPPERQQEER